MNTIDRYTGDILRKTKRLSFSTPHQMSLFESPTGYFWIGNEGMNASSDRPVSPGEASAITYLLGKGMLKRVDRKRSLSDGSIGWMLMLHVDITAQTTLLPANEAPTPQAMFLAKYNQRKAASSDFLGMVRREFPRNQSHKAEFCWVYYAGMGEARYEDMTDEEAAIVKQMIAEGTIVEGSPMERPMADNQMQVTYELEPNL